MSEQTTETETPANPWDGLRTLDPACRVMTLILVAENLAEQIEKLQERVAALEKSTVPVLVGDYRVIRRSPNDPIVRASPGEQTIN